MTLFTVELYFEELNEQLASALDDRELFIIHAMFVPLFCREVSRQLVIDRGFKYRNILDLFTGKAQQILYVQDTPQQAVYREGLVFHL